MLTTFGLGTLCSITDADSWQPKQCRFICARGAKNEYIEFNMSCYFSVAFIPHFYRYPIKNVLMRRVSGAKYFQMALLVL